MCVKEIDKYESNSPIYFFLMLQQCFHNITFYFRDPFPIFRKKKFIHTLLNVGIPTFRSYNAYNRAQGGKNTYLRM